MAADEIERLQKRFKDHQEAWRSNNAHHAQRISGLELRVKQLQGQVEAERAIASALAERLVNAGIELEHHLEHLIIGRDP
jgi:hypothetical protein